jgi:hypothetical protein
MNSSCPIRLGSVRGSESRRVWVKVVRLALENAVSVHAVLLLTEATMTEVPDSKPEKEPVGADAGL